MPIRTISFIPKYVLDESPSLDAYGYFTNAYYYLDDEGSY
jgi:hypothetical protein